MHLKKEKKIFTILLSVSFVTTVILLLAIKVIAPVCSGMIEMANGHKGFMKCHYTSVLVVFLTIILLVNIVSALVTKQQLYCGTITIVVSILIIVAFNDHFGIGICSNREMACHITASCGKLCAIIQIIIGTIMIIVLRKEKGKSN